MRNKIVQIIALSLPLITVITAQPDFPGAPAQAPIGGLGLLAAAGGVEIQKWMVANGKPSWVGYAAGLSVFFVAVIIWRSIFMGVLEGTLQ